MKSLAWELTQAQRCCGRHSFSSRDVAREPLKQGQREKSRMFVPFWQKEEELKHGQSGQHQVQAGVPQPSAGRGVIWHHVWAHPQPTVNRRLFFSGDVMGDKSQTPFWPVQ